MKKLFVITLMLLLAVTVFCACSEVSNSTTAQAVTTAGVTTVSSDTDTTTAPTVTTSAVTTDKPASALEIVKDGKSDYVIICSDSASGREKTAVADLRSDIRSATGLMLDTAKDNEVADSEYEILIGETNRPESAKAAELIGDKDYMVTVIGKKLVIYANDSKAYEFALLYVKRNFLEDKENFVVNDDLLYTSNIVSIVDTGLKASNNTAFSMFIKLNNVNSKATIHIGSPSEDSYDGFGGFGIVITKKEILFNRHGRDSAVEMGKKLVSLDVNRWYEIKFEIESSYCRFYLVDDMEGVEPWPEFELSVGLLSDKPVYVKESSGYGVEIDKLSSSEYKPETPDLPTYKNSFLPDKADPDIFYHDGKYYIYVTSSGYEVYESTDLVKWTYRGKAVPNGGWGINGHFWAPDVEYINGKFYMAVSFAEEGFGLAVADSPTGPFECMGDAPLLKKTIDGHLFVDDDGKIYLYYTSWYDGRSYGIYGVELDAATMTPKWETEVKVISPTQSWEMMEDMGGIVEAPYMLKHNGLYYLVYSGSHTESKYYAVGYATSASPLGTFKKYSGSPILNRTSDANGPAHCSIANAPDGSMVIVYHTHKSQSTVHARKTCIDRIRFAPTESGVDKLEVYGPTIKKQYAVWLLESEK